MDLNSPLFFTGFAALHFLAVLIPAGNCHLNAHASRINPMKRVNMQGRQGLRKGFMFLGATLIVSSVALFAVRLIGLLTVLDLRAIASLAVAGCMLLAVVFWEH